MTRADVMTIFPTATEEQITQILNSHHNELSAEQTKVKNAKDAKAEELAKLQAQLEELQSKDMPDIEKFQKQIEKLQGEYDKAQQTIKNMELKTSLLGQGLSEEDADNFINSMNGEKFDATVIGNIIKNAISKNEQSKLDGTPDPSGGGKKTETQTDAEKIAANLYGSATKDGGDILAHYI